MKFGKHLCAILSFLFLCFFAIFYLQAIVGHDSVSTAMGYIIDDPFRFFYVYLEKAMASYYDGMHQNRFSNLIHQKHYIRFGVFNNKFWTILLPSLITYISFYTKWRITNKIFKKNYMLWFYILVAILFIYPILLKGI